MFRSLSLPMLTFPSLPKEHKIHPPLYIGARGKKEITTQGTWVSKLRGEKYSSGSVAFRSRRVTKEARQSDPEINPCMYSVSTTLPRERGWFQDQFGGVGGGGAGKMRVRRERGAVVMVCVFSASTGGRWRRGRCGGGCGAVQRNCLGVAVSRVFRAGDHASPVTDPVPP